jgi:hypothetical protein
MLSRYLDGTPTSVERLATEGTPVSKDARQAAMNMELNQFNKAWENAENSNSVSGP